MTIGIWVLGDQLNATQAALASVDPADCRVLLVESSSVLAQRLYHRQKLVLVWSAMRHFAAELQQAGWLVDHRQADSFAAAVRDWIREHGISELRIMDPADLGFGTAIERLQLPVPLVWLPSTALLWLVSTIWITSPATKALPCKLPNVMAGVLMLVRLSVVIPLLLAVAKLRVMPLASTTAVSTVTA